MIICQFCAPVIENWGALFLSCLSFSPSIWNFNLAYNLWTVSAGALILRIASNKIFSLKLKLLTITLELFFKWLILVLTSKYIRVFILHMSISCDKIITFYWYISRQFCPCDFGHLLNWPLSGAFVFLTFKVSWGILFLPQFHLCNPVNLAILKSFINFAYFKTWQQTSAMLRKEIVHSCETHCTYRGWLWRHIN